MSWGRPYLKVADADGVWARWALPTPLPSRAGAFAESDGDFSGAAQAVPVGSRLAVRWRAPGFANPRKLTFHGDALGRGVALACDVMRAADAAGVGWSPDPSGRPLRAGTPVPLSVIAGPAAVPSPTGSVQSPPSDAVVHEVAAEAVEMAGRELAPVPLTGVLFPRASSGVARALAQTHVLDPRNRVRVSPDNLLLRAVEEGQMALGATVSDLITMVWQERYDGWEPAHRSNMKSVLGFIDHLMRYREPFENDPADVAEWKNARLRLPGVEEEASMHAALLLPPDFADAVNLRRGTDRRIERLNAQAIERHERAWERYLAATRAAAAGERRGRLPDHPADVVVLREQPESISPRAEELFAGSLGMLLAHAERLGLLLGPNPWAAFAPKGRTNVAYRRPQPLRVHQRNVLPMGLLVDLSDAIASMGPRDRERGVPGGERFRALLLATCAGGRPQEYAGQTPADYVAGIDPELLFRRSGAPTALEMNDGNGWKDTDGPKGRKPGEHRAVGLPRPVADAIDAHIAAGYPSLERLWTGPEGGPLRMGNLADTYWRPAVEKVCGASSERVLRQLEFRWLRKGAVTWMLRAGRGIGEVSESTGHDPAVMFAHYAGVTKQRSLRQWNGWDDAWSWAVEERELP